jgi:DHA2 family multidrug resistance protein
VVPGITAGLVAWSSLPRDNPSFEELRRLDLGALGLGAVALAALEIAVKEAPDRGWASSLVAELLGLCLIAAAAFVYQTLQSPNPLVDLRTFGNRNFLIGCLLSFVLGIGLFGSVYLMPIFLAYVRGHNALEIGKIMLVTGAAQLMVAPLAVILVRHFDERLLAASGFLLFAIGLGLSFTQTKDTDFGEMLWPQIVRGSAIMFCILAPTELALGQLPKRMISDASGLFNMMRNLGGAIGIAVIDTIVYGHAPEHARAIVDGLIAGDLGTAKLLAIPPDIVGPALLVPEQQAVLAPLIERAAYVQAVNDAWAWVALITFAVIVVVPFARLTTKSERFSL